MGRKNRKRKCHIHPPTSGAHTISVPCHFHVDHLAEGLLVSFSTVVTLLFPPPLFIGELLGLDFLECKHGLYCRLHSVRLVDTTKKDIAKMLKNRELA